MSEIRQLDELREYITAKDEISWDGHKTAWVRQDSLLIYLDAIENEIAERFMELLVDADGVPIHMGDLLDCKTFAHDGEKCKSAKVTQFRIDEDEADVMVVLTFDSGMWTCRSANPNKCRHVEPRTVEDVLREFAQEMNENLGMYTGEVIDADEWRDADSETVKKYAAEIRELMEVDE